MMETKMSAQPGTAGHYTFEERRKRIGAIIIASSGNLVEWFDFYIYAFCAIYFAPAFFPKSDPTAQLLNTAGVFAAGFLMRPIGGWLFGRVADRSGRRTALLMSVTMMCAGSLLIASLPGYATIGAWAPVLLLVARLLQGLSVGGQYGTTATYMSEVALQGKRGFYSSFQYVTLIGGQLFAVLVVVLLQQLLDEAELKAWGWRIPFVIGAITALLALLLQRTLHETTTAENRSSKAAGSVAELFPTEVRALGVGLAYAVANALFGGSAEYVALGLKSLGHETTFYWYVTGMMAVAFLVSLRLPRQASYLHHDH